MSEKRYIERLTSPLDQGHVTSTAHNLYWEWLYIEDMPRVVLVESPLSALVLGARCQRIHMFADVGRMLSKQLSRYHATGANTYAGLHRRCESIGDAVYWYVMRPSNITEDIAEYIAERAISTGMAEHRLTPQNIRSSSGSWRGQMRHTWRDRMQTSYRMMAIAAWLYDQRQENDTAFLRNAVWSLPCMVHTDEAIFVSDTPHRVHFDARGALHCETGPAIEWRDGWKIWCIDGVAVDEQIVLRPETQTIEQIERERNNDIRAIRMERYGLARYLEESGAEVIDERRNDIEGTYESLLRDREGNVYLWPTCPSGRVCPPLRVPPEIETCEEAGQWLAGDQPFRVIART